MGKEKPERLQKYLARCGVASRRKAEEIIKQGLVTVNGQIISEMGFKIEASKDLVEVQGKKVEPEKKKVYLLLNKPSEVVTTLNDPQGREKVTDLLQGVTTRVYPVGRLDYHSEGLLLLTNDGELAYRLTHPSFAIAKTYLVKVQGQINKQAIKRLQQGVELEDGPTQPALVKIRQSKKTETLLEITIKEGRNRQVRRMCKAVGYTVISLKRIKFGTLDLGNLPIGHYRALKQQEISALKRVCQLK